VISAVIDRSPSACLLVGAVRGRVDDVARVLEKLDDFAPERLGAGLSFDELTGLTDHFVHRSSEPLITLTTSETAEVLGLAKFGEVRVPHPAYVAVLEWAADRGLRVEPLEPSDESYATMFTDHISYVELVRRTLRERQLTRRPPTAATADEYALKWEATVATGRGSRSFLAAREGALAEGAERLLARGGRIAVVVDRERFEGVRARLSSPAGLGS
jgi:hypothetical protein